MNQETNKIDCEQSEELLILQLYGELEDHQHQLLVQHLKDCERCRELQQSYLKVKQFDDENFKNDTSHPLPILETTPKNSTSIYFAAAALILISLSLVYVFTYQTEAEQTPERQQTVVATSPHHHDEASIEFDPFSPITLNMKSKTKRFSSFQKNSIDRLKKRLESFQSSSLFEGN